MRSTLLAPLVLLFGVAALLMVFVLVTASQCSLATKADPEVEAARRAAQVRDIYERLASVGRLEYAETPWMCRPYHVRFERDQRGFVSLLYDGYLQNLDSSYARELQEAKGKRIALMIRDIDGDGKPDDCAGPELYTDEGAPLFSLIPSPPRRPHADLASAVDETWATSMDRLVKKQSPQEAGRPDADEVK